MHVVSIFKNKNVFTILVLCEHLFILTSFQFKCCVLLYLETFIRNLTQLLYWLFLGRNWSLSDYPVYNENITMITNHSVFNAIWSYNISIPFAYILSTYSKLKPVLQFRFTFESTHCHNSTVMFPFNLFSKPLTF